MKGGSSKKWRRVVRNSRLLDRPIWNSASRIRNWHVGHRVILSRNSLIIDISVFISLVELSSLRLWLIDISTYLFIWLSLILCVPKFMLCYVIYLLFIYYLFIIYLLFIYYLFMLFMLFLLLLYTKNIRCSPVYLKKNKAIKGKKT